MGIQVSVELKDLPVEFKQELIKEEFVRNDCGIYDGHCDYCQGAGCHDLKDVLYVTFPKSGKMMSYLDDILVFDNKNANHQFREELEEHNIPYVRW